MSSKEFKEKVVPFKKILPEILYNNISKFHSRWFKFSFRSSARVKPIDSLIINYKDAAVLASWIDGPTIIVAKIEGFIFSTEKGQDNFQEKATVARMKYNYYSQHTTYTYKGYPYLSFGYNNLSFIERECQVRWSYGYYFTPKIKDQGNYPLDELEVFALIPKSSRFYN
ncbi:unnamed protein product [Rhizophagus irregularis]|nr:unnamed protein product [Rhizophagus irregularis]